MLGNIDVTSLTEFANIVCLLKAGPLYKESFENMKLTSTSLAHTTEIIKAFEKSQVSQPRKINN